jgi:hypothetical protein
MNDPGDKEHRVSGHWWLPGSEERVIGRLDFDASEGARVVLSGDLQEVPWRTWSWPSLFGEAADGTKLTLLQP